MLFIAALLVTVIAIWQMQSVWFAAIAKLPPKLQDSFTSRFAADPYIWTEPSFRPLRRRYALSQALLIATFAMWALVALPERTDVAMGFGLVAAIGAFFLIYRLLRHGL